jgi:hypothetical protein
MAQYIDKDALVAEIRSRLLPAVVPHRIDDWDRGADSERVNILSFIDTLEVKEVDLEKIFNDEYSKFSNDPDAMDYAFPIDLSDYKDFAKHFFELGLKAAQKGMN